MTELRWRNTRGEGQPNKSHGVHLNPAARLSKGWGRPRFTELWLNNYYGGSGTSPQTQYVYIDNISVATTEGDLKPVVAQPRGYVLHDNYPNPFNPETTISFLVPEPASVKIDIYNVMGQQIATLLNSTVETGYHEVNWNGTNRSGKRVADGVYFYRMEADGYVQSRKMLLLK